MTEKKQNIKGIALISGGLDSILAARLIMEQGVEVIGFSCLHPFHASREGRESFAERGARQIGMELVRKDVTREMIALVKDPPHGFGKFLNPCIDCRINYLSHAQDLLKERGASFLITGEVLGQRPMSQRRDSMDIIDRDSSLRGLIVRPLCAKLLRPTIPEQKGWIDREKLLAFSGRGRKDQLALAEKYKITEFDAPAGGCLLTMEDFARKVKDLLDRRQDVSGNDIELLKCGRHFKLGSQTRLVVGKNDSDNRKILSLAQADDIIIKSDGVPGPVGLIRGDACEDQLLDAAAIVARYLKRGAKRTTFQLSRGGDETIKHVTPEAMGALEVDKRRV